MSDMTAHNDYPPPEPETDGDQVEVGELTLELIPAGRLIYSMLGTEPYLLATFQQDEEGRVLPTLQAGGGAGDGGPEGIGEVMRMLAAYFDKEQAQQIEPEPTEGEDD